MAKAAVPAVSALLSRCVFAAVNSMINGVQIGTITYSFKQDVSKPGDIIADLLKIGLSEVELMSDDGERLAGAPSITSSASERGSIRNNKLLSKKVDVGAGTGAPKRRRAHSIRYGSCSITPELACESCATT